MLATQHRQECTLKQSQRAPGTDITETNNRKQYHTRQRLALPTLLFVTMHFGLVNSYPSIFNVEFFLKLIAHSVVPVDFSSLRESVWTRMTQSGRAKHKRLVYTETWLNRFNKHPELTIVTIFLRTVLPTLDSHAYSYRETACQNFVKLRPVNLCWVKQHSGALEQGVSLWRWCIISLHFHK